MLKNVASQTVEFFVFDYSTGAAKTGDAANITMYVSKDDGTLTALTDTSAAEISSTNAPGWYRCDVSQTESNANKLLFTGKSSTSNVAVVGRVIYTRPQYAADMVISSGGVVSGNVTQFGGAAGTFASGRPEVNTTHAAGTAWGSGAITAASIASDALTAAKFADDVSTEFRTKALALTTASGVVGSGSTTANVVASSVAVGATTSLSADAFKGRVIIFNSDTTTAALRGQAGVIQSHTSGTTPTFTMLTAAWTTAPLSGDTFTVV